MEKYCLPLFAYPQYSHCLQHYVRRLEGRERCRLFRVVDSLSILIPIVEDIKPTLVRRLEKEEMVREVIIAQICTLASNWMTQFVPADRQPMRTKIED